MKQTIAGLTVVCSVLCFTFAPRGEARGIRVDNPGTAGCQLANWIDPQSYVGQPPFNPGGVTVGVSGSDTVVTCVSDGDNSLDPTDSTSFFISNINTGSPYPIQPNEAYSATLNANYLATSGELYQYVSTGNVTSPGYASAGELDADVVVWTLTNGDTEIELGENGGWCSLGAAGASVTWGSTTLTGGCSSTTNDFLFNSAASLIGYVNDSTSTLSLVMSSSAPPGWSEPSANAAPEIDPASAIGGLTLLAGCLAVLRGGRRTLYVYGAPMKDAGN